MNPVIDIAIEAPGWEALGDPQRSAEAAIRAAIDESGVQLADGAEISVVLCDDNFIADLNRRWRGQDKPTNVLAFPAGADIGSAPVLGDIVIAFETTATEARELAKPLSEHVTHLLIHGFLHRVGYDHVADADAEVMEALEIKSLARLGMKDPYGGALEGVACRS
jgi:probable rRNA maturation factor